MPTIMILGDVYLGQPAEISLSLPDSFILNLEGPITDAEHPYPGKINLKSSAVNFDRTFSKPPIAVCLANNHIMDYGEKGLEETLSFLKERGSKFFGCGYHHENGNNPLILDVGGISVGLMGYVCSSTSPVIMRDGRPGCAVIDLVSIAEDISRARNSGAEWIVVQVHWGMPNIPLPKPEDVKIARKIIDLGADLIIGHHAHCIQPFEVYKGKYIFYGLGNCLVTDVDVWAYSTSDGIPNRRIVKKQVRRNRRSLAVVFDPSSGSVDIERLEFNNGRLSVISRNVNPNAMSWLNVPYYGFIFRPGLIYFKILHMLLRFLADPRLPTRGHFRKVFGFLTGSEFR